MPAIATYTNTLFTLITVRVEIFVLLLKATLRDLFWVRPEWPKVLVLVKYITGRGRLKRVGELDAIMGII